MTPVLPDILFEDQYKDQWEWDGWKPKAKPDAPQALKDALDEWESEIEEAEDEMFDFDDIMTEE